MLGRNQLVGFGAIILALVVGTAAFGLYALRRSTFPQQLQIGAQPSEESKSASDASGAKPPGDTPSAPTESPAVAAQPEPPAAPAPPTAPGAPKPGTDPAATSTAAAAAKATGRATGAPGTTPPVPPTIPGARGARGSNPASPGGETPPPSGTTAPPPAAAEPPATTGAASPTAPVTFDDVRVLVKSGDRTRELTGVLSLGNGQVAILDKPGGTPLVSLPYLIAHRRGVLSIEATEVEGCRREGRRSEGGYRAPRLLQVRPQLGDPLLARRADVHPDRGRQLADRPASHRKSRGRQGPSLAPGGRCRRTFHRRPCFTSTTQAWPGRCVSPHQKHSVHHPSPSGSAGKQEDSTSVVLAAADSPEGTRTYAPQRPDHGSNGAGPEARAGAGGVCGAATNRPRRGTYTSATTTITQARRTATIVSAWLEISRSNIGLRPFSGLDAASRTKV